MKRGVRGEMRGRPSLMRSSGVAEFLKLGFVQGASEMRDDRRQFSREEFVQIAGFGSIRKTVQTIGWKNVAQRKFTIVFKGQLDCKRTNSGIYFIETTGGFHNHPNH